jgi:hypothetical protein
MTTTSTLRKVLDRKQAEMCTPTPVASAAGVFVVDTETTAGCPCPDNIALLVAGASAIYQCRASEDAWALLPASGIAGTFGAGACGTYHPSGPTGTASAGSTTTLTTTLTIRVNLAGYKVRITGGTGRGQEALIVSNTVGANAVLTFVALGTALDATSTYLLLTGRFYIIFPAATPGMRYWDHALQTWSAALVVTGLTHTVIDGRLIATPGSFDSMATGTATSATATTLVNAAKFWTASQWVNFQVRIVTGTGAGQVRTITANTGTTLTVAAWTVTPDATSTYSIEGNDDFLYFIGNNATATFRYSISGNSWSTMGVRGGASAVGATLAWIHGVEAVAWNTEAAIVNGRRIYSFRGGASALLDYYDIPTNAWVAVTYPRAAEVFGAGSSSEYDHANYLYIQKDATGRWFRYDFRTDELDGWFTNPMTQGVAVAGDKAWTVTYVDGATTIRWLHQLINTGQLVFRVMVI